MRRMTPHDGLLAFSCLPQAPPRPRAVRTRAPLNPLGGELREAARVRAVEATLRCVGGRFGPMPRSARRPSLAWKPTSRTRCAGCVPAECAVLARPPPESRGLASQHGNFWNLLALCFGECVCRFPVGQMAVLGSPQVLVLCV